MSNKHQKFQGKENTFMKIKTNVKVGATNGDIYVGWPHGCGGNNHNQTVARGLKVKTSIKAGPSIPIPPPR
jgi:hypothetical protein